VAGYYVYRSTVSGGSYARITAASLNALKFTDDAVSAGHTYYYVVTTVSSNGSESVDSEQASAVIP
jgi:fibronectin type 3 domain-containing protein